MSLKNRETYLIEIHEINAYDINEVNDYDEK